MPSFKPSLNMFYNLTPNIKYVVADFSSIEGTSYWYIIVFGNFKSNVRLFKSISVLYRINRVMVHRYSENRINFLKFGFFFIIDTLEHFRELFAEGLFSAFWKSPCTWCTQSLLVTLRFNFFFYSPPPIFWFLVCWRNCNFDTLIILASMSFSNRFLNNIWEPHEAFLKCFTFFF